MKKTACLLIVLLISVAFISCGENSKPVVINPPIYFNTLTPTATPEPIESSTPGPTERPPLTEYPKFSGIGLCVLDMDSGEMLYGVNEDESTLMASITKLMTALVAFDYVDVAKTIKIENSWLALVNQDKTIENYGLKGGNNVAIDDLFALMLVKSYGDAAEILRGYTEVLAEEDFFDLMNKKAQELGMTNTAFDNAIGLDKGNGFIASHTTAYDTALLVRAAIGNTYIAEKCSGKDITLKTGVVLNSTNSIMKNGTKTDRFSFVGGKTGSTNAAKYTFGAAFIDNETGKQYAIAYLNGDNWGVLNSEMLNIIQTIIDYGSLEGLL